MQKIKIIVLFTILIILHSASSVNSQDIHFSQISKTPVFLNPANTGLFDGNWRFANNYRSQWNALGTPFNTLIASYDMPLKLRKGDLGAGIYFVNDQSGSMKLTSNRVFFSVSFIKEIRDNIFSAGAQAGYIIHSYDMASITLPEQYNPNTGYFEENLSSDIDNMTDKVNYTDINLGISWKRKFEKFTPIVGFAVFHLNSPEISYINDDKAKLPIRYSINASADIYMKNNWYTRPQLYSDFTNKVSNNLIGGIVGYEFSAEHFLDKAYAGMELRTQFHSTDALVFMMGMGFMGFDCGVSYDFNISGLSAATGSRGAIELTIVYTNFLETLTKITIPCNRY